MPRGTAPVQARLAHPCLPGSCSALESRFCLEKHLRHAVTTELLHPLITQMHLR